MSRYRATLIHLGISFLIFIGLMYLVVFVWFPDFFFTTDGGWQGVRILVLVDLVLGPLLTLVVYKAGKPGLRADLTVIGCVQALCLAAGVWIVYDGRPIAMVYVDGQFFSMNARAYRDAGATVPDLAGFPGRYPKWVMVDLPVDYQAQSDLRAKMLREQRPLRTLHERYVPYDKRTMSNEDAFDQTAIAELDEQTGAIARWLASHGGDLTDYVFYPFGARYSYRYLGFTRTDHELIGELGTPVLPGDEQDS